MKSAIVTGATGFIGRFLIRELIKQKVNVIAVVRPSTPNKSVLPKCVHTVECGLDKIGTLPQLIQTRNIDALFHIAWQGVSDADACDQEIQLRNVQSVLDVIDAMYEMKIGTFVGCGSMHEAESIVEMSEDKVITNLGYMYKSAKIAAHWMGKAKAGSYGIRFFWPLINTYGEEETSPRLINMVIRKIFNHESPKLSAGIQYYDFVHVSDVAHALYLIAEKGVDGTNYTIGSGNAKSLKDFLTIVGRIANEVNGYSKIDLGFGQITNNVVSLPYEIFDIRKLVRDTGYKPEISFEEGIVRTAEWIKQYMVHNKHGG